MMDGYDSMWGMGGSGLVWILVLIFVVLGIAAFTKYFM